VNAVLTAAVACAVYGVIEGPTRGWTNPDVAAAIAVAVMGIAGVACNQRRTPAPVIDVGVFTARTVSLGIMALAAWTLAMFGMASYLSLYLQNILALPPTLAGMAFAPLAVATAVSSSLSDAVAARVGTLATVTAGFLLNTAGLGLVATFSTDQPMLSMAVALVVLGVGAGMTMPLHAEIGARLPTQRAAQASAMLTLARETSGLFGVVVLGAVIAAFAGTGAAGEHFLAGFHAAGLVAAAVVALGGFLAVMSLSRRAGKEVSRCEISWGTM
jgi:predicted MFS family arabinose efflux permease